MPYHSRPCQSAAQLSRFSRQYINKLIANGIIDAKKNNDGNYVIAWIKFVRWFSALPITPTSPILSEDYTTYVEKIKWNHDIPKEYLSSAEIKQLASTPYDDNPDVYRAGMFSIYTGLRRSDILALRWENIHHERGRKAFARFRIKKTGTLIQLPLSLPAIRVLGKPKSEGKIFPMITESILVTHVDRWISKAKSASTSPSTASGTLSPCSCWTRVLTFTPLLPYSDTGRFQVRRTMPRCLRRK